MGRATPLRTLATLLLALAGSVVLVGLGDAPPANGCPAIHPLDARTGDDDA